MSEPNRKENSRVELLVGAARNTWLALSEDETQIIGRGATLEEALADARKNGIDDPIVIWSPKKWVQSVYSPAVCQ
jgi:hypothetical protein